MFLRFAIFAAAAASQVWATNVITIGANCVSPVTCLGFGNPTVMAQGWTLATGYQNVTIQAPLADGSLGGPISGTEGTIYLVNQVGAGATAANNVAPPVTISGLTNAFSTRTLWTGLTLGPGTYYVVWVPVNVNIDSLSPEEAVQGGSNASAATVGSGVTALMSLTTATAVAAFPPATGGLTSATFSGNQMFLTVTGDPVGGGVPPPATPAPPSLILLLTAMAAVAIGFALKSRGKARQLL